MNRVMIDIGNDEFFFGYLKSRLRSMLIYILKYSIYLQLNLYNSQDSDINSDTDNILASPLENSMGDVMRF